jgi:hypothetical protein
MSRADKSQRTFWKIRPDEHALGEPSLEVVLPEAARLVEIDASLLAPNVLPELWKKEPLRLGELIDYFSGKHYIQVDKGGYKEPMPIPGASSDTVKHAVSAAVKSGRLWPTTPALSVLGEDVPVSLLNDDAELYSPPPPVLSTDLLPLVLASAWTGNETTAHMIHVALSTKRGKTLPWLTVKTSLDDAFRLGLLERSIDSKDWPTDLGGASAIKIKLADQSKATTTAPTSYGAKAATAELETNEIQDLSDVVLDIKKAAAGQKLRFKVTVELGEGSNVPQGVVDQINALLAKIRAGWKLG